MPQVHITHIKPLDGVPAAYTLVSPGLYKAPLPLPDILMRALGVDRRGEIQFITLNREKIKSQPTRMVVYGIMARA